MNKQTPEGSELKFVVFGWVLCCNYFWWWTAVYPSTHHVFLFSVCYCRYRALFQPGLLLFIHPVQPVAYRPSYLRYVVPDCRISALSEPSQLLSCFPVSISPLNPPSLFYCLSFHISSTCFLLSPPLHLLPPLWSFSPLNIPALGPPCVFFLSSSPRDKEPRWHDGFHSGLEQFAPGPPPWWLWI